MTDELALDAWETQPVAHWQAVWRIPALFAYAAVASTNDIAMRLAGQGAAAGTTVLADRQTAGRGRAGREWRDTPGGSLLVSVILRATAITDSSIMPLRVGLAAAQAIENACGTRVGIKWPNDLMLPAGGKVGGILCEGSAGAHGTIVVAGIGINVHQEGDDFAPEIRAHATSLRMAGRAPARSALLGALLEELRPFTVAAPPLETTALAGLAARNVLRGRTITVDGAVAGLADGVAADGTLRLRTGVTVRYLRSGTVRLAGAAHPSGLT